MNKTIHTTKASPEGQSQVGRQRLGSLRRRAKGLEGAKALILRLRRIRIQEKTCDGKLYTTDGTPICDTAEATPYMLEAGEYTLSAKSRLIQKGNGIYALRTPAILVGTHLVPGVVKCSGQAYNRLYQRIKKARQRGHKIILKIEETQTPRLLPPYAVLIA